MNRRLLLAIAIATFTIAARGANTATHDVAFWKAVAAKHYEIPPRDSALALMSELSTFLGSTDPELRDEIAYSAIVQWVYVKHLIPPDQLRPFLAEWEGNLPRGIGERG